MSVGMRTVALPDGGAPVAAFLEHLAECAPIAKGGERSSRVSGRRRLAGRSVELDDAGVAPADAGLDLEQVGDRHGHDGEPAEARSAMTIQRADAERNIVLRREADRHHRAAGDVNTASGKLFAAAA